MWHMQHPEWQNRESPSQMFWRAMKEASNTELRFHHYLIISILTIIHLVLLTLYLLHSSNR